MSPPAFSLPGTQGRRLSWPTPSELTSKIRSAGPALLFGLRLWVAVCLALYIAFWLELDNAQWAGTSAAVVCQPSLGASLRKGSFRMIGTIVGAVAIVILTACFPQSRTGFLLGLALLGAACGLVATLLRNFSAYAVVLAGCTAAIIASDELGATGGASGVVFTLAITRAAEICIGIVCAGVVLVGTDFGGARQRLATQLAILATEIADRLGEAFSVVRSDQADTWPTRRDLVTRVVALSPLIDEAIGEASNLRYRLPALRAAVNGLFAALSGWRTVANCLEQLQDSEGRREADIILQTLPQQLRPPSVRGGASVWIREPSDLRRVCQAAIRALVALPADTPSLRLLADGTAEALLGLSQTLDGLTLLANPAHTVPLRRGARPHLPDLLPALITAVRIFVTIVAVELFWLATAWPNGATAIAFAAIGVILFSPRDDQAYAVGKIFTFGVGLTAFIAGIVKFAVLPNNETFAGFSVTLGLVLVPLGALAAQSRQGTMFGVMSAFFVALVAPANQMTYDTAQFYNSTVAIVAGLGSALLAMLLLPPLSPTVRVRRTLAFTLCDLRGLAAGRIAPLAADWEARVYHHLSRLSTQIEPSQLARLAATFSIGTEIIRLRRIAHRFDLGSDLDSALNAVARGNSRKAIQSLAQIDHRLAARSGVGPDAIVGLRARGSIRVISETLVQHRVYFDGKPQ